MRKVALALTACVFAFAGTVSEGAVPLGGGVGVVHATVEQPNGDAPLSIVRVTNATEDAVDIYVNYAPEPALTDVKALSIGPELEVKGKDDAPYGAYTLLARPKASGPGAPVLAAASLTFVEGHYFSAVLHETPSGGHQLSIYDADFSPTGAALLTVRNNSSAPEVSWRIFPKDIKPEIPYDERHGTLGNGQSQVAIDVTQNDYVLEFLIDGQVVGRHPDVELEHEKNRVLTLAGDAEPSDDPVVLRRHVLEEEFQVAAGPSLPDTVTPPADPMSTTDENAPLAFACDPIDTWQTHAAAVEISATDPDGAVTNLSIDRVEPAAGGIVITTITPAPVIGGTAFATLRVGTDLPAGDYTVTMVANRGGLGHHATCTLAVTVRPITIERLRDVVAALRAAGDAQDAFADALVALLDQADQQLASGATAEACQSLKDVAAAVESEKDKAIAVAAAESLELEVKALRANLGCG